MSQTSAGSPSTPARRCRFIFGLSGCDDYASVRGISQMNARPALPEVIMVADHGEIIAVVRRHQDITEVFRLMKERLGLTNEFIDGAGGLTSGHADKILGPSESKSWGPTTFDLFCEMFAIEFHVRVDLDAAKRMQAVWESRERPLYPNAQVKRISKKLIERAKPHVFKDAGRLGGLVRSHLLTPKQRSEIARKGGKAKQRKQRREKRSRALMKDTTPLLDKPRLARPIDAHAS